MKLKLSTGVWSTEGISFIDLVLGDRSYYQEPGQELGKIAGATIHCFAVYSATAMNHRLSIRGQEFLPGAGSGVRQDCRGHHCFAVYIPPRNDSGGYIPPTVLAALPK